MIKSACGHVNQGNIYLSSSLGHFMLQTKQLKQEGFFFW